VFHWLLVAPQVPVADSFSNKEMRTLSRIRAHQSTPGVTNLFETESYFLVQIHAKGYQFDTHFWNKNLLNLSSVMLSIKLKIFSNVKTLIMFMLLPEQARGRPTRSVRATCCSRAPCWWPLVYTQTINKCVKEKYKASFFQRLRRWGSGVE